jgi:tRNA-Thr(GGU) m(6)t(6)A37 methyltransferase TsaA
VSDVGQASITFEPIGVIHTPFHEPDGMPIQAVAATGYRGVIELRPDLVDGLHDLDGMSHLILIYHLHRMHGSALTVTPFMDDRSHGVFATRSPKRPNPIGLSTVRLLEIAGNSLHIEDVDMLDGTPLLDIKPYVPALDDRVDARIGWYEGRVDHVAEVRSDRRFT